MLNRCQLNRGPYKLTITVVVTTALLLPGYSFAEKWLLSPNITLEERYDDNIRLTTGPHDAVTGTILKGSLGFSRLTENSDVTGRLRLDLSNYSGDDELSKELSKNNKNLDLLLSSFSKTELTRWGFDGSFKSDTTLRNIDNTEDLGEELPDPDAGIVTVDIRRNALRLSPSLGYKFSERTGLNIGYSYLDVRYEDNPTGSGLFDYDENSISAGMSHGLTERDTINANLGFSSFQSPDNANNQADTYNLTVGFRRAFSEIMYGSIDIGVNYTEQKSDVYSLDSSGYILRLKLNRKTEQKRFNLNIKHDLAPSGTGYLTETSQLNLSVIHHFSKRLSGSLFTRYTYRDRVNSQLENVNRYFSIRPRLSWKLDRWWTVAGGYQYRSNDSEGSGEKADSNAVFLSLTHNKPVTFD